MYCVGCATLHRGGILMGYFEELDNMKNRPAKDIDYLSKEFDSITSECIKNCACTNCDKSSEKLFKRDFYLALRDPILFEILEHIKSKVN